MVMGVRFALATEKGMSLAVLAALPGPAAPVALTLAVSLDVARGISLVIAPGLASRGADVALN